MTLTLAIPSKGRLQEQASAYFADAGITLKQASGARGYRATLSGLPDIDVMLLSASEIAAALLAGDVHLGITGEDLLRETAPELESRIALLKPLGFGFANVVVAVPQAWIDVSTMADLDDVCAAFAHRHRRRLRIATKYLHLTRAFFAHADSIHHNPFHLITAQQIQVMQLLIHFVIGVTDQRRKAFFPTRRFNTAQHIDRVRVGDIGDDQAN